MLFNMSVSEVTLLFCPGNRAEMEGREKETEG